MDQKEIKVRLKEAKDAFKNKDFITALKHCKLVLKNDKNNYNALVLFGAALQETDQKDQAPKAFKKAVEINSNQITAWQGLMMYYEKYETDDNIKTSELFEIYKQLLLLESDLVKFQDICTKISAIYMKLKSKQINEEFLNFLEEKLKENSKDKQKFINDIIIKILTPFENLPNKWSNLLENSLQNNIENASISEQLENYKLYIDLLYKKNKVSLLIEKAKQVIHEYPENEYYLEWLCKIYHEEFLTNQSLLEQSLQHNITNYYEILLKNNSNSYIALCAKATNYYYRKDYLHSSELLNSCLTLIPDSFHSLVLLSNCYLKMHNYSNVSKYVIKALEIFPQSLNIKIKNDLNLLLVQSLILQEDDENVKQGLILGEKLIVELEDKDELNFILIRGLIYTNNLIEAEAKLNRIPKNNKFIEKTNLLKTLILKKEGKLEDALVLIKSSLTANSTSAELLLEQGLIQWELGLKDESVLSFQKVIRLDPFHYKCFVYFGKYYEKRDQEKAMKCYQKALHINSRCVEAGLGLSDIYRNQKNETNNLEFLREVTQSTPRSGCKWAWLRLGLTHQDQGNFQEAVDCFRSAIRADRNDSHCWEALADAYLERGAYTAALKAYQQVVELEPSALYPAIQIATINQILGLYKESVLQFKQVLENNPRYVPALKGLGESHLLLAKVYLSKHLLGLCKDECQNAVDTLSLAIEEQKHLICLWKLFGDACLMLASLPAKWSYLHVYVWLLAENEPLNISKESQLIEKQQILHLSSRCYCRGLSLNPDNAFLWHDLALSYYYKANEGDDSVSYCQWAFSAIKRSLTIESNNWFQWNLLGVIASSSEIYNLRLAQHSFIKAIEVQNNNPIPWSNLGVLYLKIKELKLANKAFQMAQKTDPTYMESWIGQALIAEETGHHDAMDLFRHTTQLGFNLESSLGYAHFVVTTIRDTKDRTDPSYIYCIEKMYALPVVCDRVLWYTELNPTNPQAFNTLGLLFERQKLYRNASKAFEKALDILYSDDSNDMKIQNYKDMVHLNYGRIQLHLGAYEDAIHHYQQIREANFYSQCGLALAFLKAEKFEDSYATYDTALHWLAPDDGFKSHVLVAMAGIAYMFQGEEASKTLLYQCIQLKPPSIPGLFAACALGMLHGDLRLSKLVLDELSSFADNSEYMTDIANLKSFAFTLSDESVKAVNSLSTVVHRYPHMPGLWLALALLLLHHYPDQNPEAAARCARVALAFGRDSIDVSKIMSLVSLGELLNDNNKNGLKALRAAEKAVFLFPYITENWAVLLATVLARCLTSRSIQDALWLAKTIDHVRKRLPPGNAARPLTKWLSHNERKSAQLCQELT